jgi:glycine cleavage system H protein
MQSAMVTAWVKVSFAAVSFLFECLVYFVVSSVWLEHRIPDLMSENVPNDLKYAKSHEWVRREGDLAVIGISDHAQHELTDVVFVELPAVGRKVQAGEACAVVESVKTASDVYAPVSGEVVEINPAVVQNPALVNTEPYGAGWFLRLKLANPAELDALLSAGQYRSLIGG